MPSAPPAVLVSEREYQKGAAVFTKVDPSELRLVIIKGDTSESALCSAAYEHGARAAIVPHGHVYGAALGEALGLNAPSRDVAWRALITRFGVGYDNLDIRGATLSRAMCANTPRTLDASVAEHALWLIGAAAKRLPAAAAAVRAGGWPGPSAGRELAGLTLGVVGLGGIGRALAARARGLGMRVIACGASAPSALAAREGLAGGPDALPAALGVDAYTDDADAVFGGADVVALTLASTPATRHFVDARRIALMRAGALLVNVARGAIVDEAALYDACSTGTIDAALDVFEREPYVPAAPGKDLRTLDNVLMTPHIGSNTATANANMATVALANVRAFLADDFAAVHAVTS